MQNRELNTCKHDIYSFLHVRLPTNTEPLRVRYFVLCIIFAVENPATRTVCCVFAKQTKTIRMEEHNILIPLLLPLSLCLVVSYALRAERNLNRYLHDYD